MTGKLYIAVAAAIAIIAIAVAVGVFVVKKITHKGEAGEKKRSAYEQSASCQDRLPLRDVSGFAMELDGPRYVYGIEVQCKNRDLMTMDERVRDIRLVASKISPINRMFAIIRARVPIDTVQDARMYDDLMADCAAKISTLSRSGERGRRLEYERQRFERLSRWKERSTAAGSADAAKNAAYILFTAEGESERDLALEATRQMRGRMSQAGYRTKMLMGPMLLDLPMAYQGKAALRRASVEVAPPIVPALYDDAGGGARYEIYGDADTGW